MDEGQETDEQVSGPGPVFKKKLKDMEEEEEDAVEWNPQAYFREKSILYVNNSIDTVDSSHRIGQRTRVSIWGENQDKFFITNNNSIIGTQHYYH